MAITLGRLFKSRIKPEHDVLFVGAFKEPFSDPAPLYATLVIGKGSGRVHILDAQSETLLNRLNKARNRKTLSPKNEALFQTLSVAFGHNKARGQGDPLQQSKFFLSLRKHGVNLRLPKPHFCSDAVNTGLPQDGFTHLFDIGSFDWIIGTREGWRERMHQLALEYKRIAKSLTIVGGHPFDEDRSKARLGDFAKELRKVGGKVKLIRVKNAYAANLPAKPFYQFQTRGGRVILRHHYRYSKALLVEFPEK